MPAIQANSSAWSARGTSDFTLIRVTREGDRVVIELRRGGREAEQLGVHGAQPLGDDHRQRPPDHLLGDLVIVKGDLGNEDDVGAPGDAEPRRETDLHFGHIGDQHRKAALLGQHDIADVFQRSHNADAAEQPRAQDGPRRAGAEAACGRRAKWLTMRSLSP